MYIKIQWEIYDNKFDNVVLTVSTEGTSLINEFDKLGQKKLFEESLDMSIDNLLVDNTFISLLSDK